MMMVMMMADRLFKYYVHTKGQQKCIQIGSFSVQSHNQRHQSWSVWVSGHVNLPNIVLPLRNQTYIRPSTSPPGHRPYIMHLNSCRVTLVLTLQSYAILPPCRRLVRLHAYSFSQTARFTPSASKPDVMPKDRAQYTPRSLAQPSRHGGHKLQQQRALAQR